MKQQMLLLVGLPGSGKTSHAERYVGWKRLSWDELRFEDPNYTPGKFNRAQEDTMKERGYNLVRQWASEGHNVIIDNTNLTESARRKWQQLAIELDMQFQTYTMNSSVIACIARDRLRDGHKRVGRAVIERMALWNGLIQFPIHQEYVIVDMDGTLSDSSNRQKFIDPVCPECGGILSECVACNGSGLHKKDWDAFFSHIGEDDTNPFVESLVYMFHRAGKEIIIVSGRPIDKCGKTTEDWLDRHNIPYKHLFMRQGGDKRQDTIVKKEILDKLPKNQIFCAIDDRPSIIRLWRENGLNVIDVGKGVEF